MSREKIIIAINRCADTKLLKVWIKNAKKQEDKIVEEAAFRRLISLAPNANGAENSYPSDSVEYDFWRSISAYEQILSEENGKVTRLSRVRLKVQKVGEIEMVKEWASSEKFTDGYETLLKRKLPHLMGEAIAIRHPRAFTPEIVELAKAKLTKAGVDVNALQEVELAE